MLTGDKYDLFRPVCNRPEKKRKIDRGEGGWGLGAEGLGAVGGDQLQETGLGLGGNSVHNSVATVGAISRLAHPTFLHQDTFIHFLRSPASPHLPYLPFPSLFIAHHFCSLFLSLSLSLLYLPSPHPPPPRRDREPSGSLEQQV